MIDSLEQLKGALAGRYTFERELGRGGMATVYLARDLRHRRTVAIKVLNPELAIAPERFLREIEIAAALSHPHILPLYDSGAADGMLYYVMPHVEGETLRDRLAREQMLTIESACSITREIADALTYAHAHHVVHRDIKPGNVLLSSGHAVVADFGIAKAVDLATTGGLGTSGELALGTPLYMAPEQAAADRATDHRADIYALGIVAYEMLAGRTPYSESEGKGGSTWYLQPPTPISSVRPECPAAFASLVMRSISLLPQERPQHATEIVHALDAFATPAGEYVGRRPHRSRRLLIATSISLVVLLVAAMGLVPPGTRATLMTLLRRPDPVLMQGRVLVAPFENKTGDARFDVAGVLVAEEIGRAAALVPGMEVVDAQTALTTKEIVKRIPWPLRSFDQAIAMAQEVGATTLVSGAIYTAGDSLLFLTKVTDVRQHRLVRTLDPVKSTRAQLDRAIILLQQRVAGSLAQVGEVSGGTTIGSLAEPPSLAAYEEVYRGVEAHLQADDSSEFTHLERAAQLDTAYTTPLVFLAFARTYNHQYGAADTIVRRAERLSDLLTPAERALLDHVEAFIRGDRDEAVRHAQRFAELMPGSQEAPLLLASVSLSAQKPRLALSALKTIDPDRGLNLAAPVYWAYQAEAAGQLGDWEKSLAMAQKGLGRFPRSTTMGKEVAHAFARLGRVSEMQDAIDRLPSKQDQLLEQSQLAVRLWADLLASGHASDAAALVMRYAKLLDAAAADTARDMIYARASVLWRAGRLQEARSILQSLAARDTGISRLRDLSQLGIVSARLNDEPAALLAEREISDANSPYQRGTRKLLQAEIAAAIGDRDRAVELLRQALSLGVGLEFLGGALLDNPDLTPLRGYPPYEELLKPVG